MKLDKESAVERAKQDLAGRLSVPSSEIVALSVKDKEYRDMSLGAATENEMAAQMISYGWRIILSVNAEDYEYRADKYQLRLYGYKGRNHVVVS